KRTGHGDRPALARSLERIWNHLLGDEMAAGDLGTELSQCMSLLPAGDEEPWSDLQPYADDAASSLAFTLRALSRDDPMEAMWAARRAYDSVDYYVMNRLGVEGEDRAVIHPIVQAEFARQRRDLDELHDAGNDTAEVITARS